MQSKGYLESHIIWNCWLQFWVWVDLADEWHIDALCGYNSISTLWILFYRIYTYHILFKCIDIRMSMIQNKAFVLFYILQMSLCNCLHLDSIQFPTASVLVGKAVGGIMKAISCPILLNNSKYRWLYKQYKEID